MKNPIQRLQNALLAEAKRASKRIQAALEGLAKVHAERLSHYGGAELRERHEKALLELSESLSKLQAAADLGGRLEIRFPSSRAASPEEFSTREEDVISNVVPSIVFQEALDDLLSRDPYGAEALKAAGLEVEDVYGGVLDPTTGDYLYRHGFALARAADVETASKVKERLAVGLSEGKPTSDVIQELQREWHWPRAYAEVVTRNNFATATTAGRFREADRVSAAGISVGFEFMAVMDSNTRPGHAALNGMKFRHDDPLLREWSPPLAPNCRCTLSPLIGEDVPEKFQQLPPGASKDPGYGRRPDLTGRHSF